MSIDVKSVIENYGVNDIKTLEGIEAIRLRPGMYIGSIGPEGVRHITLEIISNAVDEYLNGHCTERTSAEIWMQPQPETLPRIHGGWQRASDHCAEWKTRIYQSAGCPQRMAAGQGAESGNRKTCRDFL